MAVSASAAPATARLLAGVGVEFRGVGLDRPLVLVALPVAATLLWYLLFRRREGTTAGVRARRALFATRVVVVGCLLVAAAGPHTVAVREVPGGPRVTMLVDRSASMGVQPRVADDLAAAIEARGVAVERTVVAAGNRSRLGDALVANLREGGSVLVVSDGHVTGGRSLARAADVARRLNATVNAVALEANRTERYVAVAGPSTTSVGVRNRFLVVVDGALAGGAPAELVVSVDGEVVRRTTVPGETRAVEVRHDFSRVGTHRVTARLEADDRYAVNDVYRTTVRVAPPPAVLYVSRGDYPLEGYLRRLYDVERARSIPADLSGYAAVVLQNVPAREAGNVTALQRSVLNGTGLVVAGGDRAFENGGYSTSPLGAMVPVREGDQQGRRSRIVLAVDVSGSTSREMRRQKALALDVLNQLGDQNAVGVVAFDDHAYRVANLTPLGEDRDALETKIRRLRSGGRTDIAVGLSGAGQLLGDGSGTVILISDGRGDRRRAVGAARRLAERGVRVVAVGVGRDADVALLRAVAEVTGGSFVRANETSRLRIRFGDREDSVRGGSLTVVDDDHFVTAGVRTTASLPFAHDVRVRRGASFLVATGRGDPAVSAWRYGTGRVVAITAYGSEGRLDGLLSAPDSLLVSRAVNYAVGDPRRVRPGTVRVPDTRVGRPTTVVYHGGQPPDDTDLPFARAGPNRFEATVRPASPGYRSLLGREYAVNYRREYAGFGRSRALDAAVSATGGRLFAPGETDRIARAVARQAHHVRPVRTDWAWLFFLAALAVFLGEVCARRLLRFHGTEAIP